jgi:periplasmic divalent cation tolerance protein
LVKNNLSPCVQIIPNIKSVYRWKNKLEHSSEILLLIKTIPEKVQKCKNIILKHHNYDTPELIVMDGYILEDDYQAWFIEHCRKI